MNSLQNGVCSTVQPVDPFTKGCLEAWQDLPVSTGTTPSKANTWGKGNVQLTNTRPHMHYRQRPKQKQAIPLVRLCLFVPAEALED